MMLLFAVMGVLAVGGDLYENGALKTALMATAALGGVLFVRPRRGKVVLLLVAAALGVATWSIRATHIETERESENATGLAAGDNRVRATIVKEMGIAQVAGEMAEMAERLDPRTLAGFADRYGKAMSAAIFYNSTKDYPFFYGPACGLVFALEYRLTGTSGAAPTVNQATYHLGNGFYRVNVPRPAWLDAIPLGKGPAAVEDALKGCSARFSKERQKKMAS